MTDRNVSHRFELDLEVPGTPADVWPAIATADGIASWMLPTELDAREGGALAFHMGPGVTSHGRVTAFEPPRRFQYEEAWDDLVGESGADVSPLVTEFLVEARSGGTCVVRIVTSAFGVGADWENEFFDEMARGWAPMLDNLRLYLTHFPGRTATSLRVGVDDFPASPEEAVDVVAQALGVGAPGEPVTAFGISGHVERVIPRHFLVRLDEPVAGFLSIYSFDADAGSGVHLQCYLFSDGAADFAGREQPIWQSWLEGVARDHAPSGATRA